MEKNWQQKINAYMLKFDSEIPLSISTFLHQTKNMGISMTRLYISALFVQGALITREKNKPKGSH